MPKFIIFIFLTIFICLSDCLNRSIIIQESSLCIKDNYVMPLYSTRFLRMTFNRTRLEQLNIDTLYIRTTIVDQKVANFEDHQYTVKKIFHLLNNTEKYNDESNIVYNLKIHANYINQTYINYYIETINTKNRTYRINCSVVLLISAPKRLIDKIFKTSVPCIIMLTSIQMGMVLDVAVLKELIRRPIQILIGFICQYGFMPLIAFAISKIFRYKPIYGLGLFVLGCCPGAAQSNQWTVIFDGDLNLSAFMSFASTVASFFMMPLWLYTLGQYAYLRELKIHVPFFNLMTSLLTIIGPLSLGMLIVYFIPKLKPIMQRILKPVLVLLILYFFSFGLLVHFYLFSYIDLRTALSAPFLPWFGFFLGGLFAWICKQDWKRVITIGLETGVQNIGIAMMVFYYSFPSPESSQASVIPIIVAYLSVQPLLLILIFQIIRRKCCKPEIEPVHHKSVDKLSKATRQLSDIEEEPINNIHETRKASIPTAALDVSPDSKPVEI